jgi:hypothetical protein
MKIPAQVSGGAGARRFRLKALGPAEYSPPRLPNENPQAGERLGVSALKSRPPWRIGDVGAEGSYAIATLMLAARHYLLLLPLVQCHCTLVCGRFHCAGPAECSPRLIGST